MTEVLLTVSQIITNKIITILIAHSTEVVSMLYNKIHYKIHITHTIRSKYSLSIVYVLIIFNHGYFKCCTYYKHQIRDSNR